MWDSNPHDSDLQEKNGPGDAVYMKRGVVG